ncbi:general substrate transporter [Aaosphaeria arxii CBS 175.79]|uniref:General substrate transporter n=1 Tax=Aaosphaeria arxii CBS 175.79 TaxID=1450172 RepID=A0A6A5Y9J6_9PLEO|nr:general substrate transporter [Aaosphaeria arxii CBS 175.79]KAF2021687.1 general substrate transporter [Aaosphaeria arxii CBS 175.79]
MAVTVAAASTPLPPEASARLMAICLFFGLASLAWGYNIGIMATIYVHPGFIEALHKPSKATTGFITSIYYVGTWISYIYLGHVLADRYGRRVAAANGVLITAVGAALQASADGAKAMILGRITCGVGLAIVSSSVPLYQRLFLKTNVAPAKHRGRYVVINHIGLVAGLAVAFWTGFGISHWESERGTYYGWRISMALQFIPEVMFLAGVFFCPETPRWLVEHGRSAAARRSLAYLRALEPSSEQVNRELREIEQDVERRKVAAKQSWTMLFTHRPLFNRLWRAALLSFMGQMAGNTSMKYYLPTILMNLGLERKMTLMTAGIETTLKIFCTMFDSWLVDRYGRTRTLVASCFIMSFSLLLNGALPIAYPKNSNPVADYVCIVFIFIYTFGFSIGFGPAAWLYGSEIFPTDFRARGLNIAASASSIGAIISSQTWPVGMQKIGSKTHFIFMSTNLVSAFIVWLYYPETSGRSLEDMDALFNPTFKPIMHSEGESERYRDDVGEDIDNTVPGPRSSRA